MYADEDALADGGLDAGSWRAERVVVLERPMGRLFAAVVEVEAIDPADGGRGGRRVVACVRDVAWDLVRACVFATGDCGLVEAVGGTNLLGAEDIDLGLVNLLDVVVGRRFFACSGCFSALFCGTVLWAAMLFDRSRPNIPELGLLLAPVVVVVLVDVEGMPLRAPIVPARVRVAAPVVVVVVVADEEPPNFGSLLGEWSRDSAAAAPFLSARPSWPS